MAVKKKKRSGTIVSLSKNVDKLTIQKSKPLLALCQSDITLPEFKIFDTYIARINSHDPENTTVRFEKGELEELLGLKQLKADVLDERLKHLMTTVNIPSDKDPRGFERIALFERAEAIPDEYGLWQVEMTCTPTAKKYFFNIEELGYLQYKLRCILNLSSRYGYFMFLYLENNRFRKTWETKVEELKKILGIGEGEYDDFRYFNRDVLKRVQKEVMDKTPCRYAYEVIKRGRHAAAIKFTVSDLVPDLTEEAITAISEAEQQGEPLWQDALKEFKFTKEQLDELFSVLSTIPSEKLPDMPYGDEFNRYHYMDQKAKEIKRRDAAKPIRNKYGYLLAILKQDASAEEK